MAWERIKSKEGENESMLSKAKRWALRLAAELADTIWMLPPDYIKTKNGIVKINRDENGKYTIESMPWEKYDRISHRFGKTYIWKNNKMWLLNPECTEEVLPAKYDKIFSGPTYWKYITKIDGATWVSWKGWKEILPHQYKDMRILGSWEYYAVKGKDRRSVVDENNNTIIEWEYTEISSKKLNGIGNVFIAEDPQWEVLVINPSWETLIKDKNIIKKELESYRSYRIYAFDGLLAYETREWWKEVMNLKQEWTENPIKLYNVEYSCYIYPSNKNPFKGIRDEFINWIGEKVDLSRIVIKSFTLNGKKYKNKKWFTRDEIMKINQQKNS